MLGQGQTQTLKLDGQPTSLGSKFSAKLDQVSQLIGFGNLYTYLACLMLEVTFVITNNSGGNVTIDWAKLYDIFTGVILSFKAADVQLWEFTQAGGQALWQIFYQKFGVLPFNQTNVPINNGAAATVYMKFPITFWDPQFSDDPEDGLIWAELLVNSTIEFTLANTGIFGAGITYTVAPTLSAYAVPRADRRFPTLIRYTEQAPTSFAQDNIAVNGLFPANLVLMPYNAAAGTTMKTFAAADITSVVMTYDGTQIFAQTSPNTMVALQNLAPKATAERLAQWEAGGAKMLVLASPELSSGQKSKVLFAAKQPILKLSGGGGTTINDYRYLHGVIVPAGKATAKAALQAIGLNPTDDELAPRFSFNPTVDPSILQVVPYTYSPKKAG